jgi:hypothetical protein
MVHGAESVRFLNSPAQGLSTLVEAKGKQVIDCREGFFGYPNHSKDDVVMLREVRIQLLFLAGPTCQFFHKRSER